MTSRAELHDIVDMLPEGDLARAKRWLGAIPDDPVLRALFTAPMDDEPVTDEDRKAIDSARESLRTGRGISTAELRHKMGF